MKKWYHGTDLTNGATFGRYADLRFVGLDGYAAKMTREIRLRGEHMRETYPLVEDHFRLLIGQRIGRGKALFAKSKGGVSRWH
jgi:hypothetical protein